MGWGQLQAQIRVQESCDREHWEDAVFIHDMTIVMFLYIFKGGELDGSRL